MAYDRSAAYGPLVGFESRKAAQMCAYFASKSPNGTIEKLKLIKLIYLSERGYLEKNGLPMLWDELYSLPHGPICSSSLNGIDGSIDEDTWSKYIARNGNIVVAVARFAKSDLDEISLAEFEALDEVWEKFKDYTASQLRNYTHAHCPEYTEVIKGRVPISYKDVLDAVGAHEASDMEQEISSIRRAHSLLST